MIEAPEGALTTLSDLIGRVYDCAIDPAGWDDTLARLVQAFAPPPWDVAALLWERFTPPTARFIGSAGIAPIVREIFVASFAGRNPWSWALRRFPIGAVVDTDQATSREAFHASALYKNFLRAFGYELAVVVTFDRRPGEALGLFMVGPPVGDLEGLKRGLRLMAPHFQRAVRIGQALGEADLRARTAEDAIERAPGAVVVLTADLEVLRSNAQARALAEGGVIGLNGGRLRLKQAAARTTLLDLARDRVARSAVFTVEGADSRPIAVLAVRLSDHGAGLIQGDRLLLSFETTRRHLLIAADRLAAWFGLTPAEARLSALLAEGGDLDAYAVDRNVTAGAIRFHLKNIYRKTGAASRAQLVARLRDLPTG